MSNVVDSEGKNIKQFTEEQFTVLDTFDLVKNSGLVVMGGPGTGKTILAKELLIRQKIESKTCAYFCYNKNLAGSVQRDLDNVKASAIDVFHVHGYG